MRQRDLDTLEFPRVLEAIAERTRSTAGREAALALAPLLDPHAVEEALALLDETRRLGMEAGRAPTADVPRLGSALATATPQGAALELRHLAQLRDVLTVGTSVRAWLGRDPVRYPRLGALAAGWPATDEVAAALDTTLDPAGQVRDEASPALRAARTTVRDLRAQVEARLLRLVRDPVLADAVGEQYVTIRNGRFVVPIRSHALGAVEGVVQDRSGSDETLFVEPLFAIDLNNRLLLAAKTEEVEEHRVRVELTALVRTFTEALQGLEAALAHVDATAAAAAFAIEFRCTCPEVGTPDVVLRAVRHPLLILAGRTVIPTDLHLEAGQHGLALTGPNTGGKTVALKTIGLCALMAQAGLFIPADEGSRLPLFAAVLADIGDEQSIERDLSTFSGHAENLAAIARAAAPGVLVLLDEPGAGTDPVEGAALAVGVLTDLLARGPRVVFTTHFLQVKIFALADPALEVAAFDVDPDTGAPRFQLTYHSVGQSLALPIARRHGVPARALEIAEHVLAGESRELALAVSRLEETRQALEMARADTVAEHDRLVATRAEAEALLADLRERKRQRWADDLETSRRFVRDLESQGKAVLAALQSTPAPAPLRAFVREANAAITAHMDEVTQPPTAESRPPRPGELVEIIGRGIRGELVEIVGPRARLQRGGLRFDVATDQLRLVGAPAHPAPRAAASVIQPPEEALVDGEINLVGQRVREALDALATFLDRAVRTGCSEVRIVHGVGSGALRRAVQEYLAASPYCARFTDAGPSAGGVGVTVVELA